MIFDNFRFTADRKRLFPEFAWSDHFDEKNSEQIFIKSNMKKHKS
jgi:hypothetical protein